MLVTRVLPSLHEAEHFRVLVIGGIASGKTSFLKRAIKGTFNSSAHPSTSTMGLHTKDFPCKLFTGGKACVQFWDVGGYGMREQLISACTVGSKLHAVVLAVDLSAKDALAKPTFILQMFRDLYRQCNNHTDYTGPILLIGMKSDSRQVNDHTNKAILALCRSQQLAGYFMTSAKENKDNNCEKALRAVAIISIKSRYLELKSEQAVQEQALVRVIESIPAPASVPVSTDLAIAEKVKAFKIFYTALRNANTGIDIFKSTFIEKQGEQSPQQFWVSIEEHAKENPDSRTMKALQLVNQFGEVDAYDVIQRKTVHRYSLNFFSSTEITDQSPDECFINPPAGSRRAGIIRDLLAANDAGQPVVSRSLVVNN